MDLERSIVAGFLGQLGFSNLNLELALWLDRHLPIQQNARGFVSHCTISTIMPSGFPALTQ
jgi:hypothetical protein